MPVGTFVLFALRVQVAPFVVFLTTGPMVVKMVSTLKLWFGLLVRVITHLYRPPNPMRLSATSRRSFNHARTTPKGRMMPDTSRTTTCGFTFTSFVVLHKVSVILAWISIGLKSRLYRAGLTGGITRV